MAADNTPATDAGENILAQSDSFVMLRKPAEVVAGHNNSPAPETPLTKKQGQRYKWLHGGRMSLYDD
jgi:hypothetical protein